MNAVASAPLAAVAAVALALAGPALSATGSTQPDPAPGETAESGAVAPDDPTAGEGYPGDPIAEARFVASEERRLIDVRTTMDLAADGIIPPSRPYIITTAPVATLILVGRASPYTIDELARIAPRSVELQPDGSYLVRENIVIGDGATLRIAGATGVVVHVRSDADGFASIVAIGGTLEIAGSTATPAFVSSWNQLAGGPDTTTDDGRAYIRILGGHADFLEVSFADLGFWSGVTGGVALTGTLLPEPYLTDDPAAATDAQLPEGVVALPDLADQSGLDTLPLGDGLGMDVYATALVQGVTISRGAFGLFVTNADRVAIRDTVIEQSLVDGLVLHRDVTNTDVTTTISRDNAQDGFNLARATSSVLFSGLTATGNGRNGITIEGRPLVDGPSATGIPVTVYGNNEVRASTSRDNGRYGIEVVGGSGITVRGNDVARNEMGIVVDAGATDVVINGNTVTDSAIQGIAARDAGFDLEVSDNTVRGADIGIYLRDAGGSVQRNTVDEASIHGISLVGSSGTSLVVGNDVAGAGPSAVDVARTSGVIVRDNDTTEWRTTKPLGVVIRSALQPLTVLWGAVGLFLLLGLLFHRRLRGIRDPYADQAPLSAYTRGVVDRDEVAALSGAR